MKWLVASLCGLAACGGETSSKLTLENNPFVEIPAAIGSKAGSTVTVSTLVDVGEDASASYETLAAGYSYRGWAKRPAGYADLGAFTPGSDLSGSAADATGVAISIEQDGAVGSAPAVVVVEGDLGEELTLGNLSALSFTNARAEVAMESEWVELSYRGMPALPAGYAYASWVVSTEANLLVGTMADTAGELDRYTNPEMPDQFELRITVEADDGQSAISNTVVLKLAHDHSQHAN